VGVWGASRATDDIDLFAEIVPSVRPRLRGELMERELDVPAMEEELQQLGVTPRAQRAAATAPMVRARHFPPNGALTVVDGCLPVITGRSP
jgi:hypothetical protein